MKTLNRYTVMLMFFLLIYISGCASNSAPRKWLSPPFAAQQEGFGGWISVKYHTGDLETEIHGELIAVNQNQLFIFTTQGVKSIPTNRISRIKLTAYDAEVGKLTSWTALGTLSTLSHGIYSVFTAPSWIITGALTARSQSFVPQLNSPPESWDTFRNYARFPQGLPEGLDMQSLKPKPGG